MAVPLCSFRSLLVAILALLGLVVGGLAASERANAAPPGFVDEVLVGNLGFPVVADFAPDGRIFIGTKDGRIQVIENGAVLPQPFVDISGQVNSFHDRGMLGLAVHPSFPIVPYVYASYTYDPPGLPGGNYGRLDGGGPRVGRVVRFTAQSANTNRAVPGSETILLGANSTLANIGDPSIDGWRNDSYSRANSSCVANGGGPINDCIPHDSPTHVLGSIQFGTDGQLYVGNGDGATFGGDTRLLKVQDLDSLAGKMLRVDPVTGAGLSDNPFYDGNPNNDRSKVWQLGLKSPFRSTIDAQGRVWIGDVGVSAWEELNQAGAGANFGYPCYEGANRVLRVWSGLSSTSLCQSLYSQQALDPSTVTAARYAYSHSGQGASIQAGPHYDGGPYPAEYDGAVFIADYNRDWIRYVTFAGNGAGTARNFISNVGGQDGGPVWTGVGADGNLHYIVFKRYQNTFTAQLRRVRYDDPNNQQPTADVAVDTTSGVSPLLISFDGTGSSDPDGDALTYAWDFGDGQTASGATVSHTYTTGGSYQAELTVTDPSGASSTDIVIISVTDGLPTVQIDTSTTNSGVRIGETVSFSGSATDPQDGALTGNDLSWRLLLHHNQHVHFDGMPPTTGGAGSFVVSDHGANTYLELCLDATDSDGNTVSACVDLYTGDPEVPDPVEYEYFEGTWSNLPNFDALTPVATGRVAGFDIAPRQQNDLFAFRFRACLVVPQNGTYTFQTTSDDGSQLFVDDALVVDNDGLHANQTESGSTVLEAGRHPIAVTMFERTGAQSLSVGWSGPGVASGTIPLSALLLPERCVPPPPPPNQDPTASAQATPTSGDAPLAVSFTSAGSSDPDGDPLTYAWDFGDGATSPDANPGHTYTAAGTYTATLTVDDGNGGTDADSVQITVGTPPPPGNNLLSNGGFESGLADWENWEGGSISPDAFAGAGALEIAAGGLGQRQDATPGTTYTVTGQAATTGSATRGTGIEFFDAQDALIGAEVQLISGSASYSQFTNQATAPAGTTRIMVWFWNEAGTMRIDEVVLSDGSGGGGNQPPTAAAQATPTSGEAPLAVSFTSAGTFDPDDDPLTYAWDFGDGATSPNANPGHTYTAAGTYTATLTVSDGNGGSDASSVQITVGSTPPPPGDNLLSNGGFESGLADWENWAGGSISSDAFAGTGALEIAAGGLGQRQNASPGVTYTVTGQAETSGSATRGTGIEFFNAAGDLIGAEVQLISGSASYSQFTNQATAPAGTTRIMVWFWNEAGTMRVDEVELTDGGAPPPPPPPPGDNLLSNGGFESGLADWENWAGGSISSDAFAGTGALEIAAGGLGQRQNASPGVTYTVTGQAETSGSATRGTGIEFFNAAGDLIGAEVQLISGSASYSQFTNQATAPAGTTRIMVWFWNEAGTMRVDEVVLEDDS